MKRLQLVSFVLAAACAFATGCVSNPSTGGKSVGVGGLEGEKKTVQKHHQEIVKALGLYDDQAMQEYVNVVGQRLAQASDLPNEEFSSSLSTTRPSMPSSLAAAMSISTAACW